jgi:hypothetical protein
VKVVLCLRESANRADQLEEIINDVVPSGDLLVCRSSKDLSRRLRRLGEKYEIAVLVAASTQELEEFVSLEGLLEGLRIILILPDERKASVVKGHKLRPRFLTCLSSDFMDVAVVLEKMLSNNHAGKRYDNYKGKPLHSFNQIF